MTTEDIIREEMESLLADIEAAYEASGKKVTGEFAEGLTVTTSGTSAVLHGYTYLAGRAAGGRPPISLIQQWVERKGIFQFQSLQEATSIAFAVANKIAQEGTSNEFHLKIYEEVITPQRIQKIIDRVSEFNVNLFVDEVVTELKVLAKNV